MCKRESASCCLPFPLFIHFSFLPIKFSATDFSVSMSQSLQICYTPWEWPSILWDRKPKCWDLFLPSLSMFPFSISHSIWYIGKLASKISQELLRLGFGNLVQIWVWLVVSCKRESACCCLSFPLFVNFSLSPSKCLSFYESHSLQILYTHWEWPSILWDRKQTEMYFAFFFPSLTPM